MKRLFVLLLFLLFTSPVQAKHLHKENYYQKIWCSANGGDMEVVLADKARIDCMTSEYAIEFDFSTKWAEAIGQSLYYSASTGKKPGVVLIIENPQKDVVYLERLQKVAKKHGIKVWIMK